MEFNQIFPSIESCKELQKINCFQESLFMWVETINHPVERYHKQHLALPIIAPAPTTDELLAELPFAVDGEFFELFKNGTGKSTIYLADYNAETQYISSSKFPVQALTDLFLKLKSEKII